MIAHFPSATKARAAGYEALTNPYYLGSEQGMFDRAIDDLERGGIQIATVGDPGWRVAIYRKPSANQNQTTL